MFEATFTKIIYICKTLQLFDLTYNGLICGKLSNVQYAPSAC